ncbi:ScbR family autoregulator-binding transcription factor, partial [Streptomyces milbemycinicus]
MQERAEQTRRTLLEAAASLFDERGYAGTSISDIAARSGHTSGAIYFHYASKEKLALAVVEGHFATWPPLIEQYTATDTPALERLVRLSFAVARAFRDDIVVRAGARLWTERTLIAAPLPPPFVGWIDAVTEMLERAHAEGDLAPHIDPERAARTVVCAFFGVHTVSEALDRRRS